MAGRPKLLEDPVSVTIKAERKVAEQFQAVAHIRGVQTGVLYREALRRYVALQAFQRHLKEATRRR